MPPTSFDCNEWQGTKELNTQGQYKTVDVMIEKLTLVKRMCVMRDINFEKTPAFIDNTKGTSLTIDHPCITISVIHHIWTAPSGTRSTAIHPDEVYTTLRISPIADVSLSHLYHLTMGVKQLHAIARRFQAYQQHANLGALLEEREINTIVVDFCPTFYYLLANHAVRILPGHLQGIHQ